MVADWGLAYYDSEASIVTALADRLVPSGTEVSTEHPFTDSSPGGSILTS
jgi:hypothetical protein